MRRRRARRKYLQKTDIPPLGARRKIGMTGGAAPPAAAPHHRSHQTIW
jgi:hypothetical protein